MIDIGSTLTSPRHRNTYRPTLNALLRMAVVADAHLTQLQSFCEPSLNDNGKCIVNVLDYLTKGKRLSKQVAACIENDVESIQDSVDTKTATVIV